MLEVIQERQGRINLWISKEDLYCIRRACLISKLKAYLIGDEIREKEFTEIADEIEEILYKGDTDDGYVEHFDPS